MPFDVLKQNYSFYPIFSHAVTRWVAIDQELYIMEIFFILRQAGHLSLQGPGDSEARSSAALIPGPNLKSYDL